MKYTIIILISILFISCYRNDKDPVSVNVTILRTYDTIFHNGYRYRDTGVTIHYADINISIKNIMNKPISYWRMNCSYDESLLVNTHYFKIDGWGCDRNFPVKINLASGASENLEASLHHIYQKPLPAPWNFHLDFEDSFKIGFIYIDSTVCSNDFFDFIRCIDDKSTWKIVWSNPNEISKQIK